MPSVAIYGDSGMGKTMLMKRFRDEHPPSFNPVTGTLRTPVLAMEMTSRPGERRFYAELLTLLGAPQRPRADIAQMEQAALRIMEAIGVQVSYGASECSGQSSPVSMTSLLQNGRNCPRPHVRSSRFTCDQVCWPGSPSSSAPDLRRSECCVTTPWGTTESASAILPTGSQPKTASCKHPRKCN